MVAGGGIKKNHLCQITLPWGFLAPQGSRNTNKWRITVHVVRAILSAVSTVYGIQKQHLHQTWEHFRMRFRTEVPQHVAYKDEKEVYFYSSEVESSDILAECLGSNSTLVFTRCVI